LQEVYFIKGTIRIERACKWIANSFTEFGPPKSKRGYRLIELSEDVLELLRIHRAKQLGIVEECRRERKYYGERMIIEWIKKERSKEDYLYQDHNLVFPTHEGTVPNMQTVRRSFKAMLRRAGFKGNRLKLRWYDLRHTHATFLLVYGLPAHDVAERLGHTVSQLNNAYAHGLPGRQKIASKIFARYVPCKLPKSLTVEEAKAQINSESKESSKKLF
jgi:integrase